MNLADLKRRAFSLQLLRRDTRGQDLIEYALLAASLVVLVAGALPANYADSLSSIWSRVSVQLNRVP